MLAERLVAHARAHGGAMSADDLGAHVPEWVAPMAVPFAGAVVHELPPNGQGIATLMALGMLDELGVGDRPVDDPATCHLAIEAVKLAMADVKEHVADPEFMHHPPAALLDRGYLARRAALIDRHAAADPRHGTPRRRLPQLRHADGAGDHALPRRFPGRVQCLGDSAPFEEWALRQREHLHRRALDALTQLADYHERRGDDAHARRYAQRQLEFDPWREEAHRQLMRVLALGGQRSAALAQYETCRRILLSDLSVEPEAETTALYERIRDGETGDRRQRDQRARGCQSFSLSSLLLVSPLQETSPLKPRC